MRTAKTILTLALAGLLAVGILGCTKEAAIDTRVAATVNGTEILEADVTATIETFRIDQTTGEPSDDVAWAKMLKSADYTPETLREMVIRNQFGAYILILQRAEAKGITPDATAVDQSIADAKASVESQNATWNAYLTGMGYASEAAYRQVLEAQNVAAALVDADMPDPTPTKAEIETYVGENAAQYAGKRLAVIYLPLTEEEPLETIQPIADEALAKIKSGTSFEDAAKEYSKDTYTAEEGGDLGWGSEAYLPDELKTAVDALEVGGVSDVVVIQGDSTNAVFIVKVTDEFVVPEDQGTAPVDFASVPESLADDLTDSFVESKKASAQNDYFNALIASDEIVINPMPEGLSYIVDMTLADTPDAEDGTESEDEGEESEEPSSVKWAAPTPTFTDDGLGIADVTEGTGEAAKEGDALEVYYSLYLEDGTFIESNVGSTPFPVTIGESNVIQGWHLGLVGTKVGGKRQLTIPASLAYGDAGSNSIPGGATLTFDIEVVSINGVYAGTEASEGSGQPSANGQ
jgi:foldase protein PrsA